MMVCYLRCAEGTIYLLKCFKYSERILLCLMLSVCEVDPMLQREVKKNSLTTIEVYGALALAPFQMYSPEIKHCGC